ncbi:DUF1552 domain-containing protein [Lentisphaera marina]|uniref:DUF1552 domain-containing protein n=1 Tax=Lentisphaera marina TaxID=1111041 RepID=UPI00236549C1|nr:DUF1552 domain-containing protein [Lentisphaera marina]MDD7987328.1 DUF1552 domain-containing protein [Lentisphaera marina]
MNHLNRRDALKTMLGALGSVAFSSNVYSQFAQPSALDSNFSGGPKRVIFFLQNQGFEPKTCIPLGMQNSGSLANATLPEPIQALQPYRERIHIINGLHGKHTAPNHSAFFGALGGYRGGDGVPPSASTIDYELSRVLPETLLPHLSIGMDSLGNMRAKPTLATLSASGAGKPIFMYSNPLHLYKLLYGGLATGELKNQHQAQSLMLKNIEEIARGGSAGLPVYDQKLYGEFTKGFEQMNGLRERLDKASLNLAEFAPKLDDRYTKPSFETDWHDVLLDLGISALKSGVTNVLTVASGRGEIFGSWKGLGVEKQGHNLGHMPQHNNPIWIKIRQYNSQMLVKLIQELESVPEGSGTMMDNTLIVYTSNNADKQHTKGTTWPFILIGDCQGAFKMGRFTQLDGTRPINALYASILKTVGVNNERFNMSEKMAARYDSSTGPLKEVIS